MTSLGDMILLLLQYTPIAKASTAPLTAHHLCRVGLDAVPVPNGLKQYPDISRPIHQGAVQPIHFFPYWFTFPNMARPGQGAMSRNSAVWFQALAPCQSSALEPQPSWRMPRSAAEVGESQGRHPKLHLIISYGLLLRQSQQLERSWPHPT